MMVPTEMMVFMEHLELQERKVNSFRPPSPRRNLASSVLLDHKDQLECKDPRVLLDLKANLLIVLLTANLVSPE